MEKLYYLDRYIKEFTAEVVEVKEIDGMYHVALDKSAFFPGGGGQPGDTGFIESSKVIDVYEDNGVVYHVLEKKPLKIHRVKCKIDWEKRYDGMQQHLGQHVLSGCFYSLFNANTVSFHMGSESSTVDIEGFLEEDKIREAERFANEIINQNIEVEFFTPSKSELKKIKIRRALPKTDDAITIVKIGDLDINACCGVHPKSTLDLRMIKIKRWEKHKGATRVEFLAGKRAIDDSLRRDSIIATICKSMKCGESEILNIISKSAEEIREYQNENRMLKLELSKYEIKEMIESADKIGDISIIKKIYEKSDLKHIGKLAEKLVENKKTIALFAVKYDDKSNLIFASSKDNDISMNELLKDAITLIDGRGGGSKFLAQGGGKKSNNLEATIDYAFMKIKNSQN
ncbi:DHHA1 domain-containing protein [Clostridium sp. NSJ-145]|uniref:alanyl-tRNA editing protein n=1 Tax=Clostridium sp. NSJ-145 TaxID=2897777 RepID=UPI001E65D49A|nr:DHHA1 domain-containing protein [Clostridium sp. NSJ-145]MCD2500598.1 DHHA1 domain-containing protein [Clostridium sp. NSJ-145]